MNKKSWFSKLAKRAAYYAGKPGTFLVAVLIIVTWAASGPFFGFNDTWQLVINTSTTIVTFLMVFLIQNSQNRDSVAVQLKLDELIRANDIAHNSLMDLEELEEDELEKIRDKFEQIAADARKRLREKRDPTAEFDVTEGC